MKKSTEKVPGIPDFITDLHDLVDDPSNNSVISWGQKGNSFIVLNEFELTRLLPINFTNVIYFATFRHQLYNYGFKRIVSPIEDEDEDSTETYSGRWEFADDRFIKSTPYKLYMFSPKYAEYLENRNAKISEMSKEFLEIRSAKISEMSRKYFSLYTEKQSLLQEYESLIKDPFKTSKTTWKYLEEQLKGIEKKMEPLESQFKVCVFDKLTK